MATETEKVYICNNPDCDDPMIPGAVVKTTVYGLMRCAPWDEDATHLDCAMPMLGASVPNVNGVPVTAGLR